MARPDNDSLITPVFKTIAVLNEAETKKAGRPIYEDVEMVEVRIAADRNYIPTFPALSMWKKVDGKPVSYAERWAAQYRAFKEGHQQRASGTPLEELPFLTNAKRAELRALSIYSAETLAALDGKNLKTLGIGGRELKDQAQAYLDNAKGSADVTRLAADNASLHAQVEEMRRQMLALQSGRVSDEESDDELKARIKELTGSAPRGTPSRETLLRMVAEAEQSEAA